MKQIPCIILLLLLSTALSAQVDMGLVRLQVDEQFLQAATVTDTGALPLLPQKGTASQR